MKYIQGYENRYLVSDKGKVYSNFCNKFLTLTDKNGYLTVGLSKNKNCKTISVHRIVAKAYIKNPLNKPQVNHIDGNKKNNHVDNLEWATASENVKHSFDTGLKTVSEKARRLAAGRCKELFTNRVDTVGSLNGRSKLKEKDIPVIRKRISNSENMSQIARDYCVTPNCIYEIKIKKRWSHVL